jgi:hypothetical protein
VAAVPAGKGTQRVMPEAWHAIGCIQRERAPSGPRPTNHPFPPPRRVALLNKEGPYQGPGQRCNRPLRTRIHPGGEGSLQRASAPCMAFPPAHEVVSLLQPSKGLNL